MRQVHAIQLTSEQRKLCQEILQDHRATSRTKRRALVLLHADYRHGHSPATAARIAAASGVDPRTVTRAHATFASDGFESALCVTPPKSKPASKLTPEHQALVFALAATPPPPGYPCWTTRTLADHLNRFCDMPPVSRELVRRLLKKGDPAKAGTQEIVLPR